MKQTSSSKKKFFKKTTSHSSASKFTLETIPKETLQHYITTIENTYQTTFKRYPNSVFINSKGKLFFSTLHQIPDNLKRINSVGIYVGTLLNSGEIRLSLEGTQLLNTAKDNYCIIKNEFINSYLSGENLFFNEIEEEHSSNHAPFFIIYDSLYEPLGVVSKKEEQKVYLNYLSKGRKMDFNKVF
ncbi:MAG: hypothetical protein ACLFPL_05205 [Candidatus Nanoarchaeia archaeon]